MSDPDGRNRRIGALRRYPALAWLVAAGALALLLPSGLTVPSSGPGSLAELAPVPGESDGEGDLSDLGEAGSGGLGSGGGSASGGGPGPGSVGVPDQGRPSLKRCVGRPPRQTEDPLSPPCVPFFEGDNGGSTHRGVGRDEVVVVAYEGPCVSGRPCPELVDLDEPIATDENVNTLPLKVYARYFNDRYQTYDRHVHLYSLRGVINDDTAIRAAIGFADERARPFALLPYVGSGDPQVYADETVSRGMVAPSYLSFARGFYEARAPLVFSYAPDVESIGVTAGGFVCRKLAERPARFSGMPQDRARDRRFGLLYEDRSIDRAVALAWRGAVVSACGVPVKKAATASPPSDTAQAVAALRTDEVTTVLLSVSAALYPLQAASAQGWSPEWVFARPVAGGGEDNTVSSRLLPQDQWRNAFGVSFDVRRDRVEAQPWFRAFAEACPDCDVPRSRVAVPRAYQTLSMLFYGIQSAGPRLDPSSLERGLQAVDRPPSSDPYRPSAWFGPRDRSWIKDAKAVWWDPSGVAPGDGGPGCYRLPGDGIRRDARTWPSGDADLFGGGQPCQGPNA